MGVVNSRQKFKTVKATEQKIKEKEQMPTISLTVGNQVNIADDNIIKHTDKQGDHCPGTLQFADTSPTSRVTPSRDVWVDHSSYSTRTRSRRCLPIPVPDPTRPAAGIPVPVANYPYDYHY